MPVSEVCPGKTEQSPHPRLALPLSGLLAEGPRGVTGTDTPWNTVMRNRNRLWISSGERPDRAPAPSRCRGQISRGSFVLFQEALGKLLPRHKALNCALDNFIIEVPLITRVSVARDGSSPCYHAHKTPPYLSHRFGACASGVRLLEGPPRLVGLKASLQPD